MEYGSDHAYLYKLQLDVNGSISKTNSDFNLEAISAEANPEVPPMKMSKLLIKQAGVDYVMAIPCTEHVEDDRRPALSLNGRLPPHHMNLEQNSSLLISPSAYS